MDNLIHCKKGSMVTLCTLGKNEKGGSAWWIEELDACGLHASYSLKNFCSLASLGLLPFFFFFFFVFLLVFFHASIHPFMCSGLSVQ